MASALRKQMRDRAGDRCEYCHLPQSCSVLPHEVDHIRARKHRGPTTLQNTCWACAYCNNGKGSNAAGYDPQTDELVPCSTRAPTCGTSISVGKARCSSAKHRSAVRRLTSCVSIALFDWNTDGCSWRRENWFSTDTHGGHSLRRMCLTAVLACGPSSAAPGSLLRRRGRSPTPLQPRRTA